MEQISYGTFYAEVHRHYCGERVPLEASIEVTRRCPIECLHCYNNLALGDRDAKRREIASKERFRSETGIAGVQIFVSYSQDFDW